MKGVSSSVGFLLFLPAYVFSAILWFLERGTMFSEPISTEHTESTNRDLTVEVQYSRVYEIWQHHDQLIWQLPSVASAVSGALIYLAFNIRDNRPVTIATLALALVLTVSLTVALMKHRYFNVLDQQTLLAMELQYAQRAIQRTSVPQKGINYWFTRKPGFVTARSAHLVFLLAMALLNWIIVIMIPFALVY